jgi:hypothetical protein
MEPAQEMTKNVSEIDQRAISQLIRDSPAN